MLDYKALNEEFLNAYGATDEIKLKVMEVKRLNRIAEALERIHDSLGQLNDTLGTAASSLETLEELTECISNTPRGKLLCIAGNVSTYEL